jgi:hypothetical protein
MMRRDVLMGLVLGYGCMIAGAVPPPPKGMDLPTHSVLLLVDESVLPGIQYELTMYIDQILRNEKVVCLPRPAKYYSMSPTEIRERLADAYRRSRIPLAGAIMVGPIPCPTRAVDGARHPIPAPRFYEDFDAQWHDDNSDDVFDRVEGDPAARRTEIWTAWWAPPTNDRAQQAAQILALLKKLVRGQKGELLGRDQMLWLAGDGDTAAQRTSWTTQLEQTRKGLDQELWTWSNADPRAGVYHTSGGTFAPDDLARALLLRRWQHAHIVADGHASGWQWDQCGLSVARGSYVGEGAERFELDACDGWGANLVTTSAGGVGNFRGVGPQPQYDQSIANALLCSDDTPTVAIVASATPTNVTPERFAPLFDAIQTGGAGYLAAGYRKACNASADDAVDFVLIGDPFYRYRTSLPDSPATTEAIEKSLKRAGWLRPE